MRIISCFKLIIPASRLSPCSRCPIILTITNKILIARHYGTFSFHNDFKLRWVVGVFHSWLQHVNSIIRQEYSQKSLRIKMSGGDGQTNNDIFQGTAKFPIKFGFFDGVSRGITTSVHFDDGGSTVHKRRKVIFEVGGHNESQENSSLLPVEKPPMADDFGMFSDPISVVNSIARKPESTLVSPEMAPSKSVGFKLEAASVTQSDLKETESLFHQPFSKASEFMTKSHSHHSVIPSQRQAAERLSRQKNFGVENHERLRSKTPPPGSRVSKKIWHQIPKSLTPAKPLNANYVNEMERQREASELRSLFRMRPVSTTSLTAANNIELSHPLPSYGSGIRSLPLSSTSRRDTSKALPRSSGRKSPRYPDSIQNVEKVERPSVTSYGYLAGHFPPCPTNLISNIHSKVHGRKTLYRNESQQFFNSLKQSFINRLYNQSEFEMMEEDVTDPAKEFVKLADEKYVREQHQTPINLPSWVAFNPTPSEWFQSRLDLGDPSLSLANLKFDHFLGPKWASPSLFFAEQRRKPLRNWMETNLGKALRSARDEKDVIGNGLRFTVISYNVLSPKLLETHSHMYRNCEEMALEWENRKRAFFAEMDLYKPDIVCLQEIETSLLPEYDDYFYLHGYIGVYKKRTGEKTDGCAIYYRDSKFRYVDGIAVEFNQPNVELLNRDNVGLLIKLEEKEPTHPGKPSRLVIGNTHLLFNPKRLDVKCAQVQVLLAELDRLAFTGFKSDTTPIYHPTIITGDFNTEPYSPISRFMVDGKLPVVDIHGNSVLSERSKRPVDFLPSHLGITDQCQHYKVLYQRLRQKRRQKHNQMEVDSSETSGYVNISLCDESEEEVEGEVNGLGMEDEDTVIANESTSQFETLNEKNAQFVSPGLHNTGSSPITSDLKYTNEISQVPLSKSEVQIQSLGANEEYQNTTVVTERIVSENDKQQLPDPSTVQALRKAISRAQIEPVNDNIICDILNTQISCTFGVGEFSHGFNFKDVHSYDRRFDETPKAGVTTKQNGWVCVDYIYYSTLWDERRSRKYEGKLKLIQRLGMLSRQECQKLGDIPRHDVPSDHFPIVAEFVLMP